MLQITKNIIYMKYISSRMFNKLAIIISVLSIVSCAHLSNKDVIAYNKSKTIILTQDTFDRWLNLNPKFIKLGRKNQIESYFYYQYLLNNQGILSKETIDKLKFKNITHMYSQARELKEKDIKLNSKPSRESIDKLFNLQKIYYQNKGDKVRIYQIYKKYSLNTTQKDRNDLFKSMQIIRKNVDDLDSFKKLATNESDSQLRLNNGLVGNVLKGTFPEKLDDVIMRMKKNEISDIVKTSTGLMLFYCEKRIPKPIKTDEQIRKFTISRLNSNVYKKNLHEWQSQQIDTIQPVFNWGNINNISLIDGIVVTSNFIDINNRQLKWLMQIDKITNIDRSTIKNTVNNYLINKYTYSQMDNAQQEVLENKSTKTFRGLVIDAVQNKIVEKQFSPIADENLKKHYQANISKYKIPEQYNITILVLDIDKNNRLNSYKKAETIYSKIKNNQMIFSNAINKYSDFKDKLKDGSVKNLSETKIIRQFGFNLANQLKRASIGEISNIVESDDADYIYIVRLDNIISPHIQSFNEVKSKIKTKLEKQSKNKVIKDVIDRTINHIIIPKEPH